MKFLLCFLFFILLSNFGYAIPVNDSLKNSPNIIFIYSDDQRFDAMGANGNQVILTPELDKMAHQGIRFTNANVVFSLCSPSRAALLTGRYGSSNGVLELGSDLNPGEKTIAQYLQEEGYLTGMSGKWHIGRTPLESGFDFSVWFKGNGTYYGRTIHDEGQTINPEMHCDLYSVKRSIDFIEEAAKGDRPFFLFHNTQLPHMDGKMEWNAQAETKQKYVAEVMPVTSSRLDNLQEKPEYLKTVRNKVQAKEYGYPDAMAIQNHTLDYYSVITEMDQFLGQLFRKLESLGLLQNTYIFFMSDNGWMLGEHGFTSKVLPYRPSTRVPFFVIGPGLDPSINGELVLNIDMAPTILEMAGLKKNPALHGESIVPLLNGKSQGWRKSFVYEGLGTYGGAKPNLSVISKKYRYIETFEDEKLTSPIFHELYDQLKDEDERHNLADQSKYKKVMDEAHKSILQHKHTILNQP